MEKLKMHSPDLTQGNIAKLTELFPNCVTESKAEDGSLKRAIDFDLLRQELSGSIVEGPQERYQLNWPGKRNALLATSAPVAKTLRPIRKQSLDFDQTKNIYIEGDNLDALKLLQESYLGKIKVIYIDPPYNTGKDFLYRDDFRQNTNEYLLSSAQKDDDGSRLVANSEANGRYHSDWLSMMYPRLRLARNLLSNDGAIFISIDDSEHANLKRLCDEIFGEENFIASIVWKHTEQSKNDERHFSRHYNIILTYSRSREVSPFLFPRTQEDNRNYSNPDRDPNGDWRSGDVRSPHLRENLRYRIKTPNGSFINPPENGWRWSESEVKSKIATGEIVFNADETRITRKIYLNRQLGRTPENLWVGERFGTTRIANSELKQLFESIAVFDTPKPVELIKRVCQLFFDSTDFTVLDFFSGSATTAHAVMSINAEDCGTRRFILVQLPERCEETSDAFKAGFSTIAEIGKERIRRAGQKIKASNELIATNLDIGFRVLKVESSNMKDIFYSPHEVKQGDLIDQIENIKEDRTPDDLLFQVLLDWGVDLTLPISRESVSGKTVFFVDGNALAACFDKEITDDLLKTIAQKKPLRAVFRDAGFSSDSSKINVEQIFKLLSPSTELRCI